MSKFTSNKGNRYGIQRNNSASITNVKTNYFTVKPVTEVLNIPTFEEIPLEKMYSEKESEFNNGNPMKYSEIPDPEISKIINTEANVDVEENWSEGNSEKENSNEKTRLKEVVNYIIAKERLDKIIKKKKWNV